MSRGSLTSLWVVIFAAIVSFPSETRAEVYTSVEDLSRQFFLEHRVVDALEQYLTKTERRLDSIRRYLSDYHEILSENRIGQGEFSESEESLERLAGNPLQAFHLMKRMAVDWKHIDIRQIHQDWKAIEEVFESESEDDFVLETLPVEEDLHGAAKALLRLQTVYKLNISTLVRGNVLGVPTSAELRAQDCLYMGKHSFNLGLYGSAIQWFEEAYMLAFIEKNATVSTSQVKPFINVATKAYDYQNKEAVAENGMVHLQSDGFNPYSFASYAAEGYHLGERMSSYDEHENFDALCRGEKLLSERYLGRLRCYYDDRKSPYLQLMPAKVEQIFHAPKILLFHDAISDSEIHLLKQMGKPSLSRGLVQGTEGGNTVSNVRTSKVAWLDEVGHPVLENLNRRVEYLTGLSTTITDDAEVMQVANYGTGGHYSAHYDYLLADKTDEELEHIHPKEIELGDRVGTFMFYLSDVLRGGATAFPKLGISLWPKKGTAVFWSNLKRSGEGDQRTLHGGCPVVYGSKWVANKWIRERGQFRKRLCTLSPDE